MERAVQKPVTTRVWEPDPYDVAASEIIEACAAIAFLGECDYLAGRIEALERSVSRGLYELGLAFDLTTILRSTGLINRSHLDCSASRTIGYSQLVNRLTYLYNVETDTLQIIS
ncbi:hypothetical protein NA8A_24029 [Nitratireductor indicus C115]|uniref:Uncharacterized protein n=1 Tax=Nitratireductor indicus C115 TaxID=1231190 RepID=K2MX12_9HYPH|nr:hypothetical protein NA8A_24029 [Nitratireductor indicus C115]